MNELLVTCASFGTWFKSIPGPIFATIFPIGLVLLILVLRFLRNRIDTSRSLPTLTVPDEKPNNLLEIAALRGEHNEIIRMILFELYCAGLIEPIRNKDGKIDKKSKLRRTAKSLDEVPTLSPQARYALSWFNTEERVPKEIFQNSPIATMAKTLASSYEDRFESFHLVQPRDKRLRYLMIVAIAWGLYFLPGIAKFFIGMVNNHHVGFLAWEIVAGTIILAFLSYPHRLSYLGRTYLKELAAKCFPTGPTESLKNETTDHSSLTTLMLTAGILGIPFFAGTPFADFATIFNQGGTLSGGCGAGCGDGCGGGCGGGCGCGGCGGCGCG